MSTQHTPGEWRISGISQEDGSISIAKNQIVICYVTNAASIFEVVLKQTPETQFANARLIAAAPDMYEALKSIVEDHEFCGDDWGDRRDAWIETARAALQGESHE